MFGFSAVLKILSVIWLLLYSSLRCHIVVSHSEREVFKTHPGKRFVRHSGLALEAKSYKMQEQMSYGDVQGAKNVFGPSAACNV